MKYVKWSLFLCCIAIIIPQALWADTLMVNKLYTTFKNFKQDKYQQVTTLQSVAPIDKGQHHNWGNELYFYKQNEMRSLPYFLKSYAFIYYQQHWYINTERFGAGVGFSKVLVEGKYWAFMAVKPFVVSEKRDLVYHADEGLFAADTLVTSNRTYMYYAMNTDKFELTALTFAGMLKLLNPYPDLQIQFVKDKYNDDPFVILAYLKELNRYIAYFEQRQ